MRDKKDLHKYRERGEKEICGPVMGTEKQADSNRDLGQTGNAGTQKDRRILPKGGSSTAPPKSQR